MYSTYTGKKADYFTAGFTSPYYNIKLLSAKSVVFIIQTDYYLEEIEKNLILLIRSFEIHLWHAPPENQPPQ